MKKSLITTSGLALLLGTSVALAAGWKDESFPPFDAVDTHHTGQITLQQAKTHPAVVSAAMKAKPGMTGDQAVESFFSEAHQKYKGKSYNSSMTKEEWQGMTGK